MSRFEQIGESMRGRARSSARNTSRSSARTKARINAHRKTLSHRIAIIATIMVSALLMAGTAVGQPSAALPPPAGDLAAAQQQRQIVQPYNNAPVWKEVRSGIPQVTTVSGRETNVLIQPEGQTWRAARIPISTTGGFLFALALLGMIAFYSWRGPIVVHARPTGHLVRRYTSGERIVHWTVAITFVTLGLTGLVMTFGKSVLLPLIGYTLFSWLAIAAKNVHNFTGPVFSMVLPIMIVVFVRENFFRAYDWTWIKRFGGMLDRSGKSEVPSGKANAGQKVLFWLMVVLAGLTLIVTGLILDFPNFNQTRQTMQIANVVHMVAGMFGIILASAHIYLGTIGMTGAYDAMRHGYVDESWAREHHAYWYEEVMAEKAAHNPQGESPVTAQHRVA